MNLIESESSVMKPGDKYGRYTVLGIFKKADDYQKYAKVRCDCGSDPRFVQIGVLRNGTSASCGCLHRERVTKHGMWKAPIYNIWRSMFRRCYNPLDSRYHRYGKRGIVVCDRWHALAAFVEDMGHTFRDGLTIDRIDNNGPYSPENCRWVTRAKQNRNYSRNVLITHNGQTKCLKEWAEELGMNYGTLWDRINVQKLPPHDAFSF